MNENNKKALKIGCVSIFFTPFAIVFWFIVLMFIPIIVDNAACYSFEEEVLKNLTLPDGAQIIDHDRTCAHLSGNGDHTEFCVAIIIASDTPIDPHAAVTLPDTIPYLTDDFDLLFGAGLRFKEDFPDNGYMLVVERPAPMSSLDIRGV